MKLALIDENDDVLREFDGIPDSIILALLEEEVAIIPEYIGWSTQWGVLSKSTEKGKLMTRLPEENFSNAGYLNLTLSNAVSDPENNGFLQYMSLDERRRKGYTN